MASVKPWKAFEAWAEQQKKKRGGHCPNCMRFHTAYWLGRVTCPWCKWCETD